MHRWFDISAAEKDLGFKPIIDFREGWDETIVWFRENWLPHNKDGRGMFAGIARSTQKKIDIQDKSAKMVG
jgi:dTDP-D-glucose 4,6-dehydratase